MKWNGAIAARIVPLLLIAALIAGSQVDAGQAFVRHQNLSEMCDEAALIYRGKVVDISHGTVSMAGGELPTVTFKFEVTETFKGEFFRKEELFYAEFTVPGSFKPIVRRVGDYEGRLVLPDPPALTVGEEYLVLTNAANQYGLSNTIGLGQGWFHISSQNKTEVVVNGANNLGLFHGMPDEGLEAQGPVSYSDIARIIRAELGE